MNLPSPKAPHMDNLIATMLLAGNSSHKLNLDTIARFQGFEAGEFRARFCELETAWSRKPSNSYEVEGK
jgi:hypothetical protein